MSDTNKYDGFAMPLATVMLIGFAVAGWLTKTHYTGANPSQLIWRFFIFSMGAVGFLSVGWIAIYALVVSILKKGMIWLWGVLCFLAMIVAYLITP